ncbi:MAG: aminotransferase class III-fold pyridoxal phosphate-dependent enzyme [Deltaproteobacteria bacterium]|nr:aminotransferase class III-fold pyridoxal phosphate-dependent enzyme [Deltaproteobacteria bacterium]MBW2309023.1 aminotransferase class III-fold pyridoxal phosphate-dependent enzyme [Deltaproteobacteria bacterium]
MWKETMKTHILNTDMHKKYPYVERGEGIYLYDEEGKRYIDGAGGTIVVNTGHGIKEIARVLKDQAEKIAFSYRVDFNSRPLEELAAKTCEATGGKMDKAFFVSSGSEATELCVKLARKYHLDNGAPSKYKVFSRWHAYHGITNGALSWSGMYHRRKDYIPYLLDFNHIPPAYCYRCWFEQTPENCNLECAGALEDVIQAEGPETVSAFIAEPISGTSLCAAVPRVDYFERIREICDRYDVLLILDEVMTGFGRTGKFFAFEHFNATPDIMAIGKGVTGGYYAMAGAMISANIADTIADNSGNFGPGHTYAGNPLGCAVGLKNMEYLEKHKLVERCAGMGEYAFKRLEELRKHPTVGDIRGKGLQIGLEFVKNQETKETIDPQLMFSQRLHDEAMSRGLIIQASSGCNRGQSGDMIQLGPPYIITEEQIDDLVSILDNSLSVIEKEVGFT